MSYKAIIARAYTRPHPNADKLQIATVAGNQVIVGADLEDGTLGVFFPSDGQLSEVFCTANDLIRRTLPDGTKAGGMFDESRRVRAMNLRGVRSEGFYTTLDHLARCGVSQSVLGALKEGDTFTDLDGIPICNKYENQATLEAKAKRGQSVKRSTKIVSFPEHFDTEQWHYAKGTIPPGSLIIVTEKLHGTSQRYGLVKVQKPLTWYQKILARFMPIDTSVYEYVIGTRRTILTPDKNGFYGNEEFRRNVVHGITLHPGEILYFEVVGYTTDGKEIMSPHDTEKMGKEFTKLFGKKIHYTYGCAPNTCAMYVYRITQDGRDLSWFEVVRRCKELGLNTVPTLETVYYNGDDFTDVEFLVTVHTDRNSEVAPTSISEGVCVRVENEHGVKVYKNKSFAFKVMEGIVKDAGIVDLEESS